MTKKEINKILAGSYTPEGVSQWWSRTRQQLGGRTPSEAWDNGEHEKVYRLAKSLDN